MTDVRDYNRDAWDHQVDAGCEWTIPVSKEEVSLARTGDVRFVLTPTKQVPSSWLQNLKGSRVLCLAGAGGQQAPLLAAAGADVSVLDNSPKQLQQDQRTAEAHGLTLKTIEGDMRDLSCFADESFDLIVHPCSNCFVPDVRPVWLEAARVLKTGGEIISGFTNPLLYLFDHDELEAGRMVVKFRIPYSDERDLSEETLQRFREEKEPLGFGHTLEDQLGGQTAAGLAIVDIFEDTWEGAEWVKELSDRINLFIATRSRKI